MRRCPRCDADLYRLDDRSTFVVCVECDHEWRTCPACTAALAIELGGRAAHCYDCHARYSIRDDGDLVRL